MPRPLANAPAPQFTQQHKWFYQGSHAVRGPGEPELWKCVENQDGHLLPLAAQFHRHRPGHAPSQRIAAQTIRAYRLERADFPSVVGRHLVEGVEWGRPAINIDGPHSIDGLVSREQSRETDEMHDITAQAMQQIERGT